MSCTDRQPSVFVLSVRYTERALVGETRVHICTERDDDNSTPAVATSTDRADDGRLFVSFPADLSPTCAAPTEIQRRYLIPIQRVLFIERC